MTYWTALSRRLCRSNRRSDRETSKTHAHRLGIVPPQRVSETLKMRIPNLFESPIASASEVSQKIDRFERRYKKPPGYDLALIRFQRLRALGRAGVICPVGGERPLLASG